LIEEAKISEKKMICKLTNATNMKMKPGLENHLEMVKEKKARNRRIAII
jgi:hypothetical protein